MPLSPDVARARNRRVALARYRGPNSEVAVAARRELDTALLAERIQQVVDAAPPLTPEQTARLRALLVDR